jgi:hypothetical protein
MNANDFRRLALGMDGAIERAHMGHPDFRANGRIFATLKADMKNGMVVLTPDEQQQFIEAHPDVFSPESGAWGRAGCTRVFLASVDEETLGEAMTLAWQQSSKPKPKTKATAASRARKSTRSKPAGSARTSRRSK